MEEHLHLIQKLQNLNHQNKQDDILQINQFIGVIFASSIMGAISWLYYADRIVQLPLGIFIVSISTILLTTLSNQKSKKLKTNVNQQIEFACLLMFCLLMHVPNDPFFEHFRCVFVLCRYVCVHVCSIVLAGDFGNFGHCVSG